MTKYGSAYLDKQGKRFMYRRRIPADIKWIYDLCQIRVSLRTVYETQAGKMAIDLDKRIDSIFSDVRIGSISMAEGRDKLRKEILMVRGVNVEYKISDLQTDYEKENFHKWSEKGLQEFRHAIGEFIVVAGDVPVRIVDRPMLIVMRDKLAKRKGRNDNPLSIRTINKYMTRVGSMFNFAVDTDKLESSPFKKVLFDVPTKMITGQTYKAFSDDEIKWIFEEMLESSKYGRYQHYMYWLPLIAAHTGARIGDLASLTRDRFAKRGEILTVLMPNHKTGAFDRGVPVHSNLLNLGIEEWLDTFKNEDKLFNVSQRKNGDYDYKWFRVESRKKIKDSRKVFHSWRTVISNKLNDACVPVTHRSDLIGHDRSKDSETNRSYTDLTSLKTLKEAIEKLDYTFIDWNKVKAKQLV